MGPTVTTCSSRLTGREARTHASQGEQRCLALALRLGVHRLIRARTPLVPTLLLDDVFSELDPARSRALVAELPAGQSILTTAAPLPEGIAVARLLPVQSLERRVTRWRAGQRSPAGRATPCPACSPAGLGADPGRDGGGVHPLGRAGRDRTRRRTCDRNASMGGSSWSRWNTRPGRPGPAWNPGRFWPASETWERPPSTAWKSWWSAPERHSSGGCGDRSEVPNWSRCRVEWCVRIERPEHTVRGFDTHRENLCSERARLWQ